MRSESRLLNQDSEDWGTMALSSTKVKYMYYCSSFKCCSTTDKQGKFLRKEKVHKFTTSEFSNVCPDCKSLLFSKRVIKCL